MGESVSASSESKLPVDREVTANEERRLVDGALGPQSILQGEAWRRVQESLERTTHVFDGPGWRALVVEESTPAGKAWYAPYGPIYAEEESLREALATLRLEAKRDGAVYLRVEPSFAPAFEDMQAARARANRPPVKTQHVLAKLSARPAPRSVQPPDSRWIDVARSEAEILKDMTSTNRNLWRRSGDKGLTIRSSGDPADIEHLIRLNAGTAERRGFIAHEADYLRTTARVLLERGCGRIYLSEFQGVPVSSALVYDSPTTRIFAHAGMSAEHRKLRPNQPMIVQAILDAARQGQAVVDLFGIAPDGSPDHPWAGFTRFKSSFGGFDAHYPGTWDVPLRPIRYGAYRAARQGREASRRLLSRVALGTR